MMSGNNKLVIFFLFTDFDISYEQDLIFQANCLHWRQFALNIKFCFCFLRKIRKNVSKCSLLKLLPRMLNANVM